MKNISATLLFTFLIAFMSFCISHSDAKGLDDLVKDNRPQLLEKQPISILSTNGIRHDYIVEVAKTNEQQQTGMMFRKSIDKNTGMLFLFKEEAEHNFWMKNTLIPLDIIFIRKDGVINYIHHMAEVKSLKPINSHGEVSAVLEISGGEANMLGISVGDHILYDEFFSNK